MVNFGKPLVGSEELGLLEEVVSSGIFVHGEKTELFERRFAEHFRYKHALSVSSCTAGLHLAHFSLSKGGLCKGSGGIPEVICPAMTHVATAHAIELAGLKPVFVDCNSVDGNVDVELLEEAVSEHTVGIAAMHFNGIPCDMKKINSLANEIEAYVVEDCAIALNAKIDGIPVGLWGDVGCFSFHPVKQMTTGEGGMMITRRDELAERLKIERAFGVDRSFRERSVPGVYDVPVLGFNYRMSELSAAIGCAQIRKFDELESRRESNYRYLLSRLAAMPQLEVKGADLLRDRGFYTCIVKVANTVADRNLVINKLRTYGIQPSVYYPHPVPRLAYYQQRYGYDSRKFPNAEIFADCCVALPIGAHLTVMDMEKIADVLRESIA